MNMKKTVALILALTLLLSVCTTALAEYSGEGPIADEIKEISIIGANTTNTGMTAEGLPFYENLYKAAGVKPKLELLEYITYADAVKPRLAAGIGLADIVRLPDNDADMSYIKAGLFIDLTDLIDKYGFNLKPALEQYGATLDDLRTPDGKIYYMPTLSNANLLGHCLQINTQWLAKLGLDEPTTVDELYTVLKAFKENDCNGNGDMDDEIPLTVKRADYLKLIGAFWGLDLMTGYHLDNEGKVHSSFATESYRAYLTYMNKLYKEGLLDPEFASNSTDILTNYLAQDRMGAMYGYITDGYTLAGSNPHYSETTPVVVAVKPLSSEFVNEGFYWNNDPIGSLYGISRDCKDPESAFKFLDFCFRSREEWIVEDSDIALSCYHLPVALIPETEYSIIPAWMAERDRQIVSCRRAPLMLRYYTDEDIDVIETYTSDIQTYTNENYLKFITGDRDLSEFDQYVATLESMGMNEVIAVYQRHFE